MRILGVDGGIASVGWTVAEIEPARREGQIVAAGTWMFESPEEPTQSGPKLKNADRRVFRGQRRVVHRRARRMRDIRLLFRDQGLIAKLDRDALRGEGLDPWLLRAEGLDRKLEPREWAVALGHIAIHRGFRSNKKNKQPTNKASDDSKMLAAIEATAEKLAKWRTVGEMFARDPEFADRRRNRGGSFTRSILRDDQEAEVRKLFAAQRAFGNPAADDDFRNTFIDKAFSQRPLQSSEEKVGPCPFEPGERRTARFAPGFEKFRLYSRLAALRLQTGRTEQPLTPEQIAGFPKNYGSTAKLTYKALRKHLDLDANTRFAGIGRDEEDRDIVARHGSALAGTAKFRKVLEPAIGELETRKLLADTAVLDRAAEIITFNEDSDLISAGLAKTALNDEARAAILGAVAAGIFDEFKGAGHISAKAVAAIVPGLLQGLVYSEACALVNYDHAASAVTSVKDVNSPVARKALGEMLKQIRILERVYGNRADDQGRKRFDSIHVEMARDVGKSIEERGKIERGIERRNKEKQGLREELAELLRVSVETLGPEDLLRYELWKEQNGRSIYSDRTIPPTAILATDNSVQVDHILPWSRFGDDSYRNKTLCFTGENADKRGRTAFEWFSDDKLESEWNALVARVEMCKSIRGFKKRNYLLRNAKEAEERFRNRNLNDTRYALRALLAELDRQYEKKEGNPRRVFARPGELTAKLRQAWGIESMKKGLDGKRLPDDRHHALDAMVLAVTTESLLQMATRVSQEAERRGEEFHLRGLPEPWDGFRADVRVVFDTIFVARQEVRRERGKAHDATIKRMREIGGETVVFERKAVEKLTEKDLDMIPVPEAYGRIADPAKLRDQMVETLRDWIKADRPRDRPPLSPKGDVIRKVRVRSNAKPAVLVRGGTADRGDMVRVDVFTKPNKRGKEEFFLVPVYIHEVATLDAPPMRAVQQGASETLWPIMSIEFSFAFTLHPMSLVEIVTRDGEVKTGYFRGLDRSTGAITISDPVNSSALTRSIGARTLKSFKKLRVDRLGNISEVTSEVRTWRGKVCMSQGLPESDLPTGN